MREGEKPPLAVHRLMRALISALKGREPDRGVVEELLASPGLTEFQRRVYRAVLSIPHGSTLSYQKVAEMAGYPRAARAVGNAMRRNPFPVIIPCHRVIRSYGSLGEYSGPTGMKERLLRQEGVRIETSRESRIARSRDGDKAVDPAAKQ
ncbi:MAG: methylated-DNA--[protein]-cysteine S-methyltransferase [Actinomycetota bacterium]